MSSDSKEFELYKSGLSMPDVSKITGVPVSTLRGRFERAGILRSRAEGVKAAADQGKFDGNPGGGRNGRRDEIICFFSKVTGNYKDLVAHLKTLGFEQTNKNIQSELACMVRAGLLSSVIGDDGLCVYTAVREPWLLKIPFSKAKGWHGVYYDR